MKHVANNTVDWPGKLGHMRKLCQFFRNRSYVEHVIRVLPLDDALKKKLRHFSAGFAKWRYETVAEVLRQLVGLLEVCAMLRYEMFAGAQDLEFIRDVLKACADQGFWRWAKASSREVFTPLESMRRWGMICDCVEHVALRNEKGPGHHIDCDRTFPESLSCFHI